MNLVLDNVSNFDKIEISGNPDGAATVPHCPDTATYDGKTCQLGVLAQQFELEPTYESGRLFLDVGNQGNNADNNGPNWTNITAVGSNFFLTLNGVYSNFSVTNYYLHWDWTSAGCDPQGCDNPYYETTITADPIYANTLFNKVPSLYLTGLSAVNLYKILF